MVSWGAIGSAIGKGAAAVGGFLAKNAGTIASVGSSLISGLNSSSGGGTSVRDSMRLMSHQNNLQKDYTQWLNENSYKQMRTGLENAGYNPLLAVGASPQSGSVGIANATEGTTAKGVQMQSMANIFNTVANTKLQEEQAKSEQAKQANLSADTGMKLVDTLYKKGLVSWQERQNYADLAYKKSMITLNNATAKSNTMNAYSNAHNAKYGNVTKIGGYLLGRFNPDWR